jgi:hypothetical protein
MLDTNSDANNAPMCLDFPPVLDALRQRGLVLTPGRHLPFKNFTGRTGRRPFITSLVALVPTATLIVPAFIVIYLTCLQVINMFGLIHRPTYQIFPHRHLMLNAGCSFPLLPLLVLLLV